MANRRLNAIITIGGAVTAGLRSSIGSTVESLRRVGSTIQQIQRQQRDVSAAIEANRRAGRSVTDLQRQYDQLTRSLERLRQSQNRLARNDAARGRNNALQNQVGSSMRGTAMAGAAIGLPIIGAAKQAMEFQYQMRLIGNTADMTQPQVEELSESILDIGRKTNQSAENTQRGLGFLIAAGMELKTARETIFTVGKAATATGGDIEDIARATFTLNDSLKIKPGEMLAALDTLARAGKEGNVELKDMAKVLPTIGSGFQALKMGGREAAATIGAALQIARKGAADPDEAANNMKNFIAKVMSPDTLKKAKKNFNLDLYKVITDAQTSGKNPFDAAMMSIIKATKGDQKKIGELFQDMQVQNFIRPMIQNWDRYQEIKKQALGADGTVDEDFKRMMSTAKEQLNGFTQAFGRLGIAVGDAVLGQRGSDNGSGGLDTAAKWVSTHKELVGTSVKVVAGLMGIRMATLAVTYAWTLSRGAALAAQAAYLRVGATMSVLSASGGRMGAAVTWLSGLMAPLRAAFVSLIPAILSVGAAIMATPVGWIVAGIAAIVAGGVMIYKYWEPLKAFFVGFGQGFMEAFGPIGQAITEAFAPVWEVIGPVVMPMLTQLGDWCKQAVSWFGQLFTPISAASQTTKEFGEAGVTCGRLVAESFRLMLLPITMTMDTIKWIANNIGSVIEKVSSLGNTMSGGWDSVKNFVTGGPGPAPAVAPMRGSSAATGGAAAAAGDTYHITQLPGENAEQLARRVAEINKRNAGVRARSGMTDGALAN